MNRVENGYKRKPRGNGTIVHVSGMDNVVMITMRQMTDLDSMKVVNQKPSHEEKTYFIHFQFHSLSY